MRQVGAGRDVRHCFFKWASSISFSHSPTELQRVRMAFSFLIIIDIASRVGTQFVAGF